MEDTHQIIVSWFAVGTIPMRKGEACQLSK